MDWDWDKIIGKEDDKHLMRLLKFWNLSGSTVNRGERAFLLSHLFYFFKMQNVKITKSLQTQLYDKIQKQVEIHYKQRRIYTIIIMTDHCMRFCVLIETETYAFAFEMTFLPGRCIEDRQTADGAVTSSPPVGRRHQNV